MLLLQDITNFRQTASKLHRQCGHTGSEKLVKLLRNAGVRNRKLELEIEAVAIGCETCKKFKRPVPRPVVALPMASKFNEVIAMDLKVWDKYYFLVIVDLATRYCAATVLTNKLASSVISELFTSWISTFGGPKKILTDNGREFNNVELQELGEAFNIKIMTTAAESPWSNGACERLNDVLGSHVSKIIDDTHCELRMALAWAVSARNALANSSGFSPNQLVFGFNPGIPDVFESDATALEPINSSDIVRKNLNALHSARREFVKFESKERIRRALRHNTRATHPDDLQRGDEVYFKRRDDNQWHGPGVIVAWEGKLALVRHGGEYYRVHTCRLTMLPRESAGIEENPGCSHNENTKSQHVSDDDDNNEEFEFKVQSNTPQSIDNANGAREDEQVDVQLHDENVSGVCGETSKLAAWKRGQRFRGIDSNTGEPISGKILSRAGKATGAYRNCYNIEKDTDGSKDWYNFEKLKDLVTVPDHEEMVFCIS